MAQPKKSEWSEYFMNVAKLTLTRCPILDPRDEQLKGAAVIVNPSNQIAGIGYTGFIQIANNRNNDGEFNSKAQADAKATAGDADPLKWVIHAVDNAFMYRTITDVVDSTMYLTTFPCLECAKRIASFKIRKIVVNNEPAETQPEKEEDVEEVKWLFEKKRGNVKIEYDPPQTNLR